MVNQIRTPHSDEIHNGNGTERLPDLHGNASLSALPQGEHRDSAQKSETGSFHGADAADDLGLHLHGESSGQALQSNNGTRAEGMPSSSGLGETLEQASGVVPQTVSSSSLGHRGMWQSGGLLTARSAQAMGKRSGLSRWFWNLSIGRKQLLALVVCELVPILGLGVGATWIITHSLRQQLVERAESEVEIAQIEYRIKMDQMAFGSRGQSDNLILVNAALNHLDGLPPALDTVDLVKQVLSNEVDAREIEYATLVGDDLRVISNANRDRIGEVFNPNNLVSLALNQGKQIKASEVIAWSDFQKEGAPLPEGLDPQDDLLIRYIVTPIFDPQNPGKTIGAIVFGDIINGKLDIPREVLRALDNGYSAVYQQNQDGEFSLASGLQIAAGQLDSVQLNVPVEAEPMLQAAVESPGRTLVNRLSINGLPYTVAMRAEPSRTYVDYTKENRNAVPFYDAAATHAILVHGTPETSLRQLLRRSLAQELVVLCLSVGLITVWSLLFRRTVLKPLQNLGLVTQSFAEGDREARAEVEAYDEVGQLAMGFNDMADSIMASEQSLANEAQRQQLQAQMARQLNNLTTQMRAFLEASEIFPIAVTGVRESLAADRVFIYQLDSEESGTVVAESVLPTWRSIMGEVVADPCFAEQYIEQYRQGRIQVINNIQTADLGQFYLDELAPFEVQANLVVPIVLNDKLMGLLCIHQCDGPRDWQERETSFAQQAAIQLGYALEQAELSKAQLEAREVAEAAESKERQQNQALQLQLIELLSDVENVADGDLTVRANVSEGAIGTVADFFNSIVENLRQLVTQVQVSSLEVNESVGSSEGEIRQLTQEALRQSEELGSARQSIERMAQSIQAVATSASQAALVSQTAADTAVAGGRSMDRTVDNILTLRETIGETTKKVKRLGESSQQISKVVYLINQIAMQTNLLAINAGIEAARAGEQGQGFAVVAEEVGELAARSATATKEIEQIVTNIQRETSEVVQAMELGTSQVVEGTQVVEEAKQNLGQIVTVSQEINDLVKSISDTTVVQADTSQSITELMQKLSAIAQRTSASSTQVSDSLQATVVVAQSLQESVGTFKVA